MKLTRRAFAGSGLGLAAAALPPLPARAQDGWPARTVRIVVPFGAGGSADIYGRLLADRLSESLGQPFVIENRPGGGAVIGTDAVAKSAPDGYTLLVMSNTHTANETLLPNRPYRLMRDLEPVAAINIAHHVLVVNAALPARNVQELIALVKAKPGSLDYASSGPGTPYHIAGAVFCATGGIEVQHIPFRGSGEARNAVIGNQVPMMFDAIPTMLPHIESGRVRALATTGTRRDPLLPDVPTVAESGLPGYEASIWLGLMAPKETPRPVIEKLHAAVNGVLQSPDAAKVMAEQGSQPMPMSIAEFGAFLRKDIETQGEYIKMAKIQPQ